jgi:hypothetical protein
LKGSGIRNRGTLTVIKSTIANNWGVGTSGGGISSEGPLTVSHSRIASNFSDGIGGILARDLTVIAHSSIVDNGLFGGIGIQTGTMHITGSTIARNLDGDINIEDGTLTINNSTITENDTDDAQASGIDNQGGTVTILNSTIARNKAVFRRFDKGTGAGIRNAPSFANPFVGTVTLQNTILAENTIEESISNDCDGPLTSLGHNLIGDPTDCDITLQASDLTGDPSLDVFTDDFTPGHGHFPLLATSQAINAGNDAACPPTDQLGQPRVDQCDIGAIEFQPSDTTPPVITVSATPEILWPPNGKLVPVTLVATIMDAGVGVDPSTTVYAVEDEYGSVQPTGSLTLRQDGRYTATIALQSSRNGGDADGRLYTIIVSAFDNAGNEGSATAYVTVPHD